MMDHMEELDGVLTFEALVMAPEELDPYVLSFYLGAMEDGFVECYTLCVMKREEGVLLAILVGCWRTIFCPKRIQKKETVCLDLLAPSRSPQ